MKVYAAIHDENRIVRGVMHEFDAVTIGTEAEWNAIIGELCRELDLARPVLLKKHKNDLDHFRHTAFKAEDFMESIDFKKLTIEIFPEKKKKE